MRLIKFSRDERGGPGVVTPAPLLISSVARRLLRLGDVEHAHSTRIDVDVFDRRGWLGYGIRLDALGTRADVHAAPNIEIASQGRSHRIAGPASRAFMSRAVCAATVR
jgi:hypothetical protein